MGTLEDVSIWKRKGEGDRKGWGTCLYTLAERREKVGSKGERAYIGLRGAFHASASAYSVARQQWRDAAMTSEGQCTGVL